MLYCTDQEYNKNPFCPRKICLWGEVLLLIIYIFPFDFRKFDVN